LAEEPRPSEVATVREVERRSWGLVALAAFILSIAGLGVSLWQGYLAYESSRISVLPRLTFDLVKSTQAKSVGLFVTNGGIGPAEIKEVVLTVKGKRVEKWSHVVREMPTDLYGDQKLQWHQYDPGDLVPKDRRDSLLSTVPNNVKDLQAFWRFFETDLEVLIVYCSVYGKCWKTCRLGPECRNKAIEVSGY